MGSKIYRRFKTIEERKSFYLLKNFRKAVLDFQMIENGDKILVGLSGGKDSITLFKLLKLFRKIYQFDFKIVPIIVLSEIQEEIKKNIPDLADFVKNEGEELIIKEIAVHPPEDYKKSLCFVCSWHRRKTLFYTAKELACNKVALGHHSDDIAETILLNLFYHGRLERMEPKMDFFDGEFTLIRPLAYLSEKVITDYAKNLSVHLTTCTCPMGNKTQRSYLKEKLYELEREIPKIKLNLFRACDNENEFVPLRIKRKRKK